MALRFVLILLVCISACRPTSEKEADRIFEKWNHSDTPGVAVAVVKDGKILFKKGYGSANLEYGIPVTTSTIFHIASVSKQFTAFAALMLEKEGKLSMDDDIRKYIPEVPDFGKTITLRHLATHTSGLRDQWNLLAIAGWRLDDVITKEQVLKLISKQQELNFDPGEEFLYCNTGFTLLAEVVARVSGQTFAEFCSEKIFQPLQMNHTLFYDDHEKIVPNRAYSYYPDSSGYKKSVLSYANVGATSLFTTVEDLSKWAENFSNPQVGDQSIIDKLNTLAHLNNGETFGGAMGQFIGEYKGVSEISHGGADAGYRTYFARYPDQNLAVSVFSNDASFESGKFAHQVADLFLENLTEKEEKTAEEKPDSTAVKTLSPEVRTKHLGDYEMKNGDILSVSEKDDQLHIQATGEEIYPLVPISDTQFKLEELEITLEFLEETNALSQTLKVSYSENDSDEGKRIEAFDPGSVDLSEFVGTYYSDELSTAYQFVIIDSNLVATHSRHHEIYFTPIKKNVFSGDTWFFGRAEFTRNSAGEVEGLKASAGRTRNMTFRKTE
ncbi:hypothetical protein GCM10009119_16700 [Algoriphagus jejuensis]|uniref:Beta-lactamase-related domain-containing protein n=1 Tax=Algoriphagus jejuensis TaxID=419934 RepID=A0ABN1MZ76_9BACT